jgi:3-phenylpropionate/cinnamic acid dioxygenase small subunit
MDDHGQIRALLHRYCELQDSGDIDAVSELFRHAWYRVQGGDEHFGFEAVRALKGAHNVRHADGTLRTKHVTTNTIVELDETGRSATSRSMFTVFQATDALPLQAVIAGRYLDRFEKVDGAWRFADRLIVSDLRGDLSSHLRDNPLDRR